MQAGRLTPPARKWPPTAVEIQRSGASRPKDWSTEKRRACAERVNPFLSVDFVQCIERSEMPWAKVRLAMEKRVLEQKSRLWNKNFCSSKSLIYEGFYEHVFV